MKFLKNPNLEIISQNYNSFMVYPTKSGFGLEGFNHEVSEWERIKTNNSFEYKNIESVANAIYEKSKDVLSEVEVTPKNLNQNQQMELLDLVLYNGF